MSSDIRNGVVSIVVGQWMPAIVPDGVAVAGGQGVVVNWLAWTGNVFSWAVTIVQSNALSSQLLRAIGAAVSSVAAGGAGSTVAGVGPSDPKCIVSATVVSTRGNVSMQFQDSGTSANIGARVDLDVPSGYAARCGAAFTEMRCFGL